MPLGYSTNLYCKYVGKKTPQLLCNGWYGRSYDIHFHELNGHLSGSKLWLFLPVNHSGSKLWLFRPVNHILTCIYWVHKRGVRYEHVVMQNCKCDVFHIIIIITIEYWIKGGSPSSICRCAIWSCSRNSSLSAINFCSDKDSLLFVQCRIGTLWTYLTKACRASVMNSGRKQIKLYNFWK